MVEDDTIDFEDPNLLNNYEDTIDVSQNKLVNKSLEIQQLISHFEYRLLGYMWKSNAEKYYYTGKTLMGDESLQKVMLLLHPFSREVLLISNKKDMGWQKQLLRTRLELVNLLTKAIDVDVKDLREIWRSYSNLLFNIGDIIINKNSQDFLSKVFGIDKQAEGFEGYKQEGEKL